MDLDQDESHGWGFFTGKGYYTRGNPEDCLLFVKGRMPVPESLRPLSVICAPIQEDELPFIYAPVREHSRKPYEQYRRIEQMYSNRRYLELFARQRVPGWDAWGDQVPGGSDIVLLGEVRA